MRQAATAVEEAGDGMRQQGAAGDRPGHDLGLLQQFRRQQIDQILREAPDRRGVAEQLMRVEVDASVVAVAEVEVAVDHQHFRPLQIGQRLLADRRAFVHLNSSRGLTGQSASAPTASFT